MALCDECGKVITGHYISDAKTNDNKKYCSQACFDKAHPCSVCGKKAQGKGKNDKLYCGDCWEGKGKLEDLFGKSSTEDVNESVASDSNNKNSNAALGFFIIFLVALICLIIFLKRKFSKK